MEAKLSRCFESVKEKVSFKPEIAIVLGSGLGDYAEEIDIKETLDYHEIEGFPVSTVPGHKGRFIFGYVNEVPVVAMQGRVHFYEGYPMSDVVLPIRLMKLMGAKAVFLSNAAGGINPEFKVGDLMLITDHISSFVPSPLIGKNIDTLGARFPDMTEVYTKAFRDIILATGKELNIALQQGAYVQLTGPNYETPTEINMCRVLGGSAVGMSTACEAMAAKHMGMKVCGISLITNMASGLNDIPLDHKEVQESADAAAPKFKKLVTEVITKIAQTL